MIAIAILAFSALSVYVAYDITRVFQGSPRAWNLLILGFAALFVYRAFELYFDLVSPTDVINYWEAGVALLAGILFFAALLMLDVTFRRHLGALRPAQ